jgi:hypothetical protein
MNPHISSISVLELTNLPMDLAMLLGQAKILYFEDRDEVNSRRLLEKIFEECPKRNISLRIRPLSFDKQA